MESIQEKLEAEVDQMYREIVKRPTDVINIYDWGWGPYPEDGIVLAVKEGKFCYSVIECKDIYDDRLMILSLLYSHRDIFLNFEPFMDEFSFSFCIPFDLPLASLKLLLDSLDRKPFTPVRLEIPEMKKSITTFPYNVSRYYLDLFKTALIYGRFENASYLLSTLRNKGYKIEMWSKEDKEVAIDQSEILELIIQADKEKYIEKLLTRKITAARWTISIPLSKDRADWFDLTEDDIYRLIIRDLSMESAELILKQSRIINFGFTFIQDLMGLTKLLFSLNYPFYDRDFERIKEKDKVHIYSLLKDAGYSKVMEAHKMGCRYYFEKWPTSV